MRLIIILPLLLLAEYHFGALTAELVVLYWGFDLLTPYSVAMIVFGFMAATTVWGMAKAMHLKPVLRRDEKE